MCRMLIGEKEDVQWSLYLEYFWGLMLKLFQESEFWWWLMLELIQGKMRWKRNVHDDVWRSSWTSLRISEADDSLDIPPKFWIVLKIVCRGIWRLRLSQSNAIFQIVRAPHSHSVWSIVEISCHELGAEMLNPSQRFRRIKLFWIP